jgi:hypothetical protein
MHNSHCVVTGLWAADPRGQDHDPAVAPPVRGCHGLLAALHVVGAVVAVMYGNDAAAARIWIGNRLRAFT